MGGKSKSTTVGYHYRPAFHVGLVGRMIDAFLEYRAADKTAWAGELTASGRIEIDAPGLFGGEKDQGGIVGPVDVMFGEPDQLPNPYLVDVFGNQTVAWRGMTTLVFAGGQFGAMNPYQQKSAYKIRKIKAGWDGEWGDDPCWYPETAEIPLLDGAVTMHGNGWEYQIEHFSEPNTVWDNFEIPVDGWLQGGEMPFVTNGMAGGKYWTPTRSNIWLRRRMTVHGAGLTLNIGADNGCVVWIDGLNVGSSNPENKPISSNERNPVSYELSAAGTLDVVVKAYAEISISNEGGNVVSLSFTGVPLLGINPAHLLYYIRTDREKGNEPPANINDASFRDAADRLYGEGFGLCQVVYDPEKDTPDSMAERICRIIGGSSERSLVDGQWYLDLARGDYDLESLPIMGDDDILEFKKQPTTLHGATNSLAVRYFDPVRKETVVTPSVRALGLIRTFGEIHETLDFPEIPTGELALRVAERELRARITPTQAFEVVTKPRGSLLALRRNQYFRLRSAKRGIVDMVCIVGERDMGSLRSGAVRWKVAQDVYSLPATSYAEVERGVDTRPPQMAKKIEHARAFEAPYIELAGTLPRAELGALPEDVGFLVGVAAKPGDGLDYTLATKPEGSDFSQVGASEWCPTAVCLVALSSSPSPVTVPLSEVRGLDRVAIGSAVVLGDEILRLDALQLDPPEATLARGCADTVPVDHKVGGRLWFIGEDIAFDPSEYTAGEVVQAKFLANTGSNQFPLSAATTYPVVFGSRQFRPYPPADLRVNGDPDPDPTEPLSGAVTLSWRHRDRVLQADQLVDSTMPDVGPEPGTTYGVEYFTEIGTDPVHSESGITGNESTPWEPIEGKYRIEVFAERDGIESWQRHMRVVLIGAERWTPSHLAEPPQIWLDWSSQIVESGGAVSEWRNEKGSAGGAFTQSTSSSRPQIIPADLNGLRTFRFDGSNDHLTNTSTGARDVMRNVAAGWAFLLWRREALDISSSDRVLLVVPPNAAGSRFAVSSSQPSNINRVALTARRLDANSEATIRGAVGDANWHTSFAVADFLAGTGQIYLDDALEVSGALTTSGGNTSDTASRHGISLGAWTVGAGTFAHANARVAAVVVGSGSSVLTEFERQRLHGWAAHAGGLQDRLAADHPFRHVPPYVNTPALQPSFGINPAVFGFVAQAEGGSVGIATGPAVATEFGVLLNSQPSLTSGQGITVTAGGGTLIIRLDGVALAGPAMRVLLIKHTGANLGSYPLAEHIGYWTGGGSGELEEGEVYYLRIEQV